MNFEERYNQQAACTRSYLVEGDYIKALASAQEAVAIQDEAIRAAELAVRLSQEILTLQKEKRDIMVAIQGEVERLRNVSRRAAKGWYQRFKAKMTPNAEPVTPNAEPVTPNDEPVTPNDEPVTPTR
jgi:hypothetical protein